MTDTPLARMADHVLAHGLAEATLRPLARAAGTSDRMLIYRYGTKDALLAAILDHLAERMTAMLDAIPTAQGDLLALMRSSPAQPYLHLWLELAARAARGDAASRTTGARILAHFHRWLTARLPPGPHTDATAAALLIRIEGTLFLESFGPEARALTKMAESLP